MAEIFVPPEPVIDSYRLTTHRSVSFSSHIAMNATVMLVPLKIVFSKFPNEEQSFRLGNPFFGPA
jgi:hypothetical protein